MKALKENIQPLLLSLFEIVVGVLLLIDHAVFTSGIIIAAGIVLLLSGIVSVFNYFRIDPAVAAHSKLLFKALVCFLSGYFCIVKNEWIVNTFAVLTILYGITILVVGLGKIQWTVDLIRAKKGNWILGAIAALLSIILAIIIILNPFSTINALWIFTGISLIIDAAFDIATLVINGIASKK